MTFYPPHFGKLNCGERLRVAIVVAIAAAGPSAWGRAPDVEARTTASPGPASTGQIFEPAIAAGDA